MASMADTGVVVLMMAMTVVMVVMVMVMMWWYTGSDTVRDKDGTGLDRTG